MAYKDKEKKRLHDKEYYLKNKERLWSYKATKHSSDKWKKNNADKIKKYNKEHYWDIKEKMLKNGKDWRVKNDGYVKEKDHANTQQLTDRYMKKHLLKLGYTRTQIRNHPELLESHKLIIKIKRLCKTSKN